MRSSAESLDPCQLPKRQGDSRGAIRDIWGSFLTLCLVFSVEAESFLSRPKRHRIKALSARQVGLLLKQLRRVDCMGAHGQALDAPEITVGPEYSSSRPHPSATFFAWGAADGGADGTAYEVPYSVALELLRRLPTHAGFDSTWRAISARGRRDDDLGRLTVRRVERPGTTLMPTPKWIMNDIRYMSSVPRVRSRQLSFRRRALGLIQREVDRLGGGIDVLVEWIPSSGTALDVVVQPRLIAPVGGGDLPLVDTGSIGPFIATRDVLGILRALPDDFGATRVWTMVILIQDWIDEKPQERDWH